MERGALSAPFPVSSGVSLVFLVSLEAVGQSFEPREHVLEHSWDVVFAMLARGFDFGFGTAVGAGREERGALLRGSGALT